MGPAPVRGFVRLQWKTTFRLSPGWSSSFAYVPIVMLAVPQAYWSLVGNTPSKLASESQRRIVIACWLPCDEAPFVSVALMYQRSVPVGGFGMVILSPRVSRLAYQRPLIVVLSIGLEDHEPAPGFR